MTGLMQGLVISLALTLLFELAFAFGCGVNGKRDIGLVAMVNVLTNPPAVFLYWLLAGAFGPLPVTLAVEACVVLVEWKCYDAYGEDVGRPLLLSFGANLFSYCAGQAVMAGGGSVLASADWGDVGGIAAGMAIMCMFELVFALAWGVRDRTDLLLVLLTYVMTMPAAFVTAACGAGVLTSSFGARGGIVLLFAIVWPYVAAIAVRAWLYGIHGRDIWRPGLFAVLSPVISVVTYGAVAYLLEYVF